MSAHNSVQLVDLVIEARWIVPVDPSEVVLENHAVVVKDGRIVALLPQGEVAGRFAPRSISVQASNVPS